MSFKSVMNKMAKSFGMKVDIVGNTAYMIEMNSDYRPSPKVWQKKFIYHSDDRVSVIMRGKKLVGAEGNTFSLAKLNAIC